MPWLTEDAERLRRFREGDTAMLAQVYSTYAPILGRALMAGITVNARAGSFHFGGVRSPFELDDLVQETFIRAFGDEARRAYDGVRPFRHYLTGIAKNLLVDDHRRAWRMRLVDEDEAPPADPKWPLTNPERQASDAELRRVYGDLMATLDEPTREVVRLRFEEQVPRNVVTERTGLGEMQIRAREASVRKRFFRILRVAGLLSLPWAASLARHL